MWARLIGAESMPQQPWGGCRSPQPKVLSRPGDPRSRALSISAWLAAPGVMSGRAASISAAGAGLTAWPWNADWDAHVQSEVDDELKALSLDHLLGSGGGDRRGRRLHRRPASEEVGDGGLGQLRPHQRLAVSAARPRRCGTDHRRRRGHQRYLMLAGRYFPGRHFPPLVLAAGRAEFYALPALPATA